MFWILDRLHPMITNIFDPFEISIVCLSHLLHERKPEFLGFHILIAECGLEPDERRETEVEFRTGFLEGIVSNDSTRILC